MQSFHPTNRFVLAVTNSAINAVAMGMATTGGTANDQVSFLFQAWTMYPANLDLPRFIVQDVLAFVIWYLTLLAVLWLFNERERQIDAKRELKRLLEAQKAETAEQDASPA